MNGNRPLYKVDAPSKFQAEMNTGLWYDKFCNEWKSDWSGLIEEYKKRNIEDGKKNWINTVTENGIGDAEILSETITRRKQLLESCNGHVLFFKTTGPFVTGLGREHPVENGFAWHHSLGTPYLPGSSVKGMVRSWAEQWDNTRPEISRRIFGSRDQKNSKPSCVGSVIFMDALPITPVHLKADVMTPHYGPYYKDDTGKEPPADWHNPIPIPFLVVDDGQKFLFGIIPRNPGSTEDIDDCEIVKKWLLDALSSIGAGAKTAVGYGRFEKDAVLQDAYDREIENSKIIREQKEAFRKQTKGLSPELVDILRSAKEDGWSDRDKFLDGIDEYLNSHPNPSKECIEWIRDKHLNRLWKKIWDNPDVLKGKKNKFKYKSSRARELSNKLKAMYIELLQDNN